MSDTFAVDTSVSVEKSRAELESLLSKFGADSFGYMSEPSRALIGFRIKGKTVRFELPLPSKTERRFTHHSRGPRRPDEAHSAWEQACRSNWRALVLNVKAKLVACSRGIATFEQEFLAHFVMRDGRTVAQATLGGLDHALHSGNLLLIENGNHEVSTH